MKTNENALDRVVRAVLGIALLAAGLMMAGPLKWVLLALAAVALITALTGFCLLYQVLGINTNKRPKE
jgi:uncharacterized membrane protein